MTCPNLVACSAARASSRCRSASYEMEARRSAIVVRSRSATARAPVAVSLLVAGHTQPPLEIGEVFVRLARTNQETVRNAEAYLFAIASSVFITRARKSKARRAALHDPIEDFPLLSGGTPPDRILEGKEALHRLALALEELPLDTREMFLLNREDGLTYTQIAARYAISVKVVERHIVRALNHLRARLALHV